MRDWMMRDGFARRIEDSMFEDIYDKINTKIAQLCHILEMIAALFVLVAVVIALVSLIPHMPQLWENRSGSEAFLDFLEQVFLVVIGVEFLKMLCRPTADNVLETIIFLVARHMIVVTTTTPLDDLISTISIVLLCFVRRYLKEHRIKDMLRAQRALAAAEGRDTRDVEEVLREVNGSGTDAIGALLRLHENKTKQSPEEK